MTLPLGMAGQLLEGDSHRPTSDRFGGLKVVGGKALQKGWIQDEETINIRQMLMRCPDARVVGTSVIEDYQLLFKGSKTGSYLTIEPKEGSSVPVAVWSVSETDELALDRYEGYPSFYYKKELQIPITGIRTGKVRVRKAFVYIMHEERPLGLPSMRYLATCTQGYRSFGFDQEKLRQAYADSQREV